MVTESCDIEVHSGPPGLQQLGQITKAGPAEALLQSACACSVGSAQAEKHVALLTVADF